MSGTGSCHNAVAKCNEKVMTQNMRKLSWFFCVIVISRIIAPDWQGSPRARDQGTFITVLLSGIRATCRTLRWHMETMTLFPLQPGESDWGGGAERPASQNPWRCDSKSAASICCEKRGRSLLFVSSPRAPGLPPQRGICAVRLGKVQAFAGESD